MNKKFSIFFVLFTSLALAFPITVSFASKPSVISTQYFVVMPTLQPPLPPLEMNLQPIGDSGNMMVVWTDLPCAVIDGEIMGVGVYNGHTLLGSDGDVVASHGIITLFDAEVDGKTGDLTIIMGVNYWRIIDATDDITGLHGGGTSSDSETLGVYIIQGQIHFD